MPSLAEKRRSGPAITKTPQIDPGNINGLTSKIEEKLREPSEVSKKRQKPKSDLPSSQSKFAKSSHSPSKKLPKSGKAAAQAPAARTPASAKNASVQSKKRMRDGRLKDSGNFPNSKSGANTIELGHRGKGASDGDDVDLLRNEVVSLGGSDGDINLVDGVRSDSEFEGDEGGHIRKSDEGLNRETMGMLRQLGIDKIDHQSTKDDFSGEDSTQEGGLPGHSSTQTLSIRDGDLISKRSGKTPTRFPVRSDWHAVETPSLPDTKDKGMRLSQQLVNRLHEHARFLLDQDNERFAANKKTASSEHQFYSTLMTSGTLSDKISVLTLSIQDSPLHNMKALENLLALARKRTRDQAVNVLGALKDLFGPSNLLPGHRRLVNFADQPGLLAVFGKEPNSGWTKGSALPTPLEEIHLIQWAFEDWLKDIYFQLLKVLETWSNDEVIFARTKAVEYISQLLKEKPEQEGNLLRLLVNKLGDSDKKVASKTSFSILQLENVHPLMKLTIISAIETDLLFRPGQSLHAQYYAALTLNQTVLGSKTETIAQKLLDIYFSLFLKLLGTSESHASHEHERKQPIKINKKGDIQGGGAPAGKKALQKQKKNEKSTAVAEDLREKLLSAILTGVNRAVPYVDAREEFFDKHLDTLFRVTHSANFNTSIQALILIQQLCGMRLESQDRFYRVLYESLFDSRLLASSKQALYLNLLYRALKSDINADRVKSFSKRLLQVSALHQPPFVCGVIYLLRELESTFPNLTATFDEYEQDDSDEEEVFRDVPEKSTESESQAQDSDPIDTDPLARHPPRPKYDPCKRDPTYALARNAPPWEVSPLFDHYHPSVSLFSRRLLKHEPMPPVPDLQQNTLIHFLDRFVYKNPKSSHLEKVKGISIMQPLAVEDRSSVLLSSYTLLSKNERPLNSDAFRQQGDKEVAADQAFFHRYFQQIGNVREKTKQKREKKAMKRKSDQGDDESEEEEIWKALVDSKPEIEGEDDEDDELEMESAGTDEDSDVGMLTTLNGDGSSVSGAEPDDETDAGLFSEGRESESAPDDSEEDLQESAAEVKRRKGIDLRGRKQRLKGLPTFADADDYAVMLRGEDNE